MPSHESAGQIIIFDRRTFSSKLARFDCPMKTIPHPLRRAIFCVMLTGWSGWAQGVIVWDGPVITFNHPDGAGASVRDQLTPGVWLTRDTSQGLINAATEAAYTHFFSPQDTEWAYGSLTNYAALGYAPWETWNGKHPPSMVGQPAVVHLISENIYLALTFTSWGGSGGSFSYDRSTPSTVVPEPSVGALCGWSGLCALMVAASGARAVPARSRSPRKPAPESPQIF